MKAIELSKLVIPNVTPLLRASYQATRGEFLKAVGEVLPFVVHPSGRMWELDGHRSTALFLRLPPPQGGGYLETVEVTFDLQVRGGSVTLQTLTASPDLAELFARLTDQLDRLLVRSGQP